jgi:hypothetical protein
MHIDATLGARPTSLLRHSQWDGILVAMSAAHAAALLVIPSMPLVALALWWNANTIAHNFIHRPFFRSRTLNTGYSIFLSAVQGIPQALWRHRHLAHHAGRHRPFRWSVAFAVEIGVIGAVWAVALLIAPATFLGSYLPGYALGLVLCYLQGHFEHAHGRTISHYGRIYNLCFFNDGYHVEHHLRPSDHWTQLPRHTVDGAERSAWPPVLRWVDDVRPRALELLERAVLRSPRLQHFVLAAHERAIRALLDRAPRPARVLIVGGGLFPRTAIILRRLVPDASLVVVEEKAAHIETARRFLDDRVAFHHEIYDPRRSPTDADLVIVPLAYDGNRSALYADVPAPRLLVHDWLWHRKGRGMAVSWLLLKRVNLVTR